MKAQPRTGNRTLAARMPWSSYDQFFHSLFELADIWVEEICGECSRAVEVVGESR